VVRCDVQFVLYHSWEKVMSWRKSKTLERNHAGRLDERDQTLFGRIV
jgi:hypothetical protein